MELAAKRIASHEAIFQWWDGPAVVVNPLMHQPDLFALDGHANEMPKRVGIGMRAVLPKVLLVVATLHKLNGLLIAVGSGIQPSLVVEVDTEGVPTAFQQTTRTQRFPGGNARYSDQKTYAGHSIRRSAL